MHLTSDQNLQLIQLRTCLSDDWREAQLRTHVGETLLKLFSADQFASFTWNAGTERFGDEIFLNMSPSNIQSYEEYYQFHDPITPILQRQRTATLVTQVMPQSELIKTEFFNDFLRRDGLYHGLNIYLWDGNTNIGDFRIWRSQSRSAFDANDQQLLAHLQPSLTTAIQCVRTAHQTLKPIRPIVGGRRAEVAQCVADGMNDKEIANYLGMGYATVRTHLAHLFRCFGVNNRTKLARLL